MRVHDRSRKVDKRKRRMVVHGIAMKRLLVERAAHARTPRIVADSARRKPYAGESQLDGDSHQSHVREWAR